MDPVRRRGARGGERVLRERKGFKEVLHFSPFSVFDFPFTVFKSHEPGKLITSDEPHGVHARPFDLRSATRGTPRR